MTNNKNILPGYDFANDSWSVIAQQIKAGTDHYNLGDTKTDTITVGGTSYQVVFKIVDNVVGRYKTQSGVSHKVIEMQTIVGKNNHNKIVYNSSGIATSFANSSLFKTMNNTIINYLPSDLQAVLETTTVYSGNGTEEASLTTNVAATGKLFSPCMNEYYGENEIYGYANSSEGTPQYQYYKNIGVTAINSDALAKKDLSGNDRWYWLRSPCNNFLYTDAIGVTNHSFCVSIKFGKGNVVLCFAW